MDRSKPTSGLSFRVMIFLARSGVRVVRRGAAAASSPVQPSSKPSSRLLSYRPDALDLAPLPFGTVLDDMPTP